MRQIEITDELRKTVKLFNANLFVSKPKGFQKPKTKLESLFNKIKTRKHKTFRLYVRKIIDDYERILNADPSEMIVLIKEFDQILHYSQLGQNITSNKLNFHEDIVRSMRYEDLRRDEFPNYLINSDVRTCVYCNAQSTLTLEPVYYNKKKQKDRRKVISKLQLDHFYPKSKYPFLSTSFFNLYPTCANCNLAKGKEEALFQLYSNDNNVELFQFLIDDQSILNYWMSLDLKKLKVSLVTLSNDTKLLENHNDLFQIQKVYDAQIDIAEELVWKVKANPKVYRKILTDTFHKIFPDESTIDRMILGNYSKPEETFKRPMAKYTQDIARQLNIIK